MLLFIYFRIINRSSAAVLFLWKYLNSYNPNLDVFNSEIKDKYNNSKYFKSIINYITIMY